MRGHALALWAAFAVSAAAPGFAQSISVSPELFDEMVRQRVAALVAAPHASASSSEKADAATAAIGRGDYAEAAAIIGAFLSAHRGATWRSQSLARFMQGMVRENDDGFVAHLSDWISQDGQSALPRLIRAQNHLAIAWRIRGDKFAAATRPDHLAAFHAHMAVARLDALKAIELDGQLPYSRLLLGEILRGDDSSGTAEASFQDAIAKFPEYLPVYELRLATLTPNWGGSVGAMQAFVDRYAASAGEASPRRLLYLDFYADLLNIASTNCRSVGNDAVKACVASNMRKFATRALETQVQAALALRDTTDPYEFTMALRPILFAMVGDRGGSVYSGALLQLAADRLGSSNQLTEDAAAHNNFMLDEAAATVWLNGGFYDNAEKKFQQALKDLAWAPFPDDEEKIVARAAIFDGLARVYRANAQFDNVLAYRIAAVTLAGNTNADLRYLTCYAYYRLKRFADAKHECTLQIDGFGDIHARYYRGQANKALGDSDAALADLQVVADTEDYYRVAAATGLSVLYGDRREYQAMTDSLNSHPYLFETSERTATELAISFNNRCYGYMKLGRLQKALDDCTASLRYGSLPDAYQKQQELVKLLNK